MPRWAQDRGIELDYVDPRKPVQHCFVERFGGTFRDEYLSESLFTTGWGWIKPGSRPGGMGLSASTPGEKTESQTQSDGRRRLRNGPDRDEVYCVVEQVELRLVR